MTPTADQIVEAVAAHHGMTVETLLTSRRRRPAWARMIAVYLARELTGASYTTIAASFGFADHTTARNSHQRVVADLPSNKTTRGVVELLRRRITGTAKPPQEHAPSVELNLLAALEVIVRERDEARALLARVDEALDLEDDEDALEAIAGLQQRIDAAVGVITEFRAVLGAHPGESLAAAAARVLGHPNHTRRTEGHVQ